MISPITIKIILFFIKMFALILFVITNGAAFSKWGRKHTILVVLTWIISIVGSYYIFKSLQDDWNYFFNKETLNVVTNSTKKPKSKVNIVTKPETILVKRIPLKHGYVFKDCRVCPEMIIVDGGNILYGLISSRRSK